MKAIKSAVTGVGALGDGLGYRLVTNIGRVYDYVEGEPRLRAVIYRTRL